MPGTSAKQPKPMRVPRGSARAARRSRIDWLEVHRQREAAALEAKQAAEHEAQMRKLAQQEQR